MLGNEQELDIDFKLRQLANKIASFRVSSPDMNAFTNQLRHDINLPIAEFIAKIRTALDAETRFLIVCDQFEELFVHYGNTPELHDFAKQLSEVWTDETLKSHLLFSMREDWVGV